MDEIEIIECVSQAKSSITKAATFRKRSDRAPFKLCALESPCVNMIIMVLQGNVCVELKADEQIPYWKQVSDDCCVVLTVYDREIKQCTQM